MDSTSIQFRSHTALLLAAALPYLQPAYRHPVELALKFLEFSETMKLYREFHPPGDPPRKPLHKDTGSSDRLSGIMELVYRFVQDPEGLLHNLAPVCTGKEKEIVGMLLNLMQAKSFYENYGDLFSSLMSAEGAPDFFAKAPEPSPPPPADSTPSDGFSMPDMASLLAGGDLTSSLSKEQNDTLNLLKSLLDEE